MVKQVLGILGLTVAIVWAFLTFGGGKAIDSVCVEGRLSQLQVDAINALPWDKCPGYRQRENGGCWADVKDRVVIRECSEFSRFVTFR